MSIKKILVVDDEIELLHLVKNTLTRTDFEITTCSDPNEARHLIEADSYDLLITDKNIPGINDVEESGLMLLEFVKRFSPSTEVIMMTGHASVESAIEAMKLGAFDYIRKPFNLVELKKKVERVLEYHRFINPENTIASYRNLHNQVLDSLSTVSSGEVFQEHLTRIELQIDQLFDAQKYRERILITLRDAMNEIALLSEQLLDEMDKTDPHYEQVAKIVLQTGKRI